MRINLDTVKGGLQVVYGCVFLVLILWIFPDIRSASKVLLDRAASASTLEVAGFKVAFTEVTVARGLELDDVPAADRKVVLDAIYALDSKQFVRLMAVGRVGESCEYEHPTLGMRNDVALDYELQAEGLTEIAPSRNVLESALRERAQKIAEGKSWDIGMPHDCYTLTLTDVGSRVKTVIVKNLAPAFNMLAPEGGKPNGAKKVVAMN